MTKKSFNTESSTNGLFDTQHTQDTQETKKTQGRPKKDKPLRSYRYNLNIDGDLKQYLKEIAWKNRTSITQYLNDLVRKDMEEYFANGGTKEGWEEDEL